MKKLIGYVRVSTDEQETSGNGLDAQRSAILQFAKDNGYELVEIVQEAASGKLGLEDRPVLKAAVSKSLKIKATLCVSKLDRLSRSAAFVFNLMATKAKFVVVQFGDDCDEFMIHIYAVLGEKERKMIGERTKDALSALKAKGVKLGNPNRQDRVEADGTVKLSTNSARLIGAAVLGAKADAFAERMRPTITRMLNAGMSKSAIAAELNSNGVTTARGGAWGVQTIINMMARWAD